VGRWLLLLTGEGGRSCELRVCDAVGWAVGSAPRGVRLPLCGWVGVGGPGRGGGVGLAGISFVWRRGRVSWRPVEAGGRLEVRGVGILDGVRGGVGGAVAGDKSVWLKCGVVLLGALGALDVQE